MGRRSCSLLDQARVDLHRTQLRRLVERHGITVDAVNDDDDDDDA
jgi:hypothetical protein